MWFTFISGNTILRAREFPSIAQAKAEADSLTKIYGVVSIWTPVSVSQKQTVYKHSEYATFMKAQDGR